MVGVQELRTLSWRKAELKLSVAITSPSSCLARFRGAMWRFSYSGESQSRVVK